MEEEVARGTAEDPLYHAFGASFGLQDTAAG